MTTKTHKTKQLLLFMSFFWSHILPSLAFGFSLFHAETAEELISHRVGFLTGLLPAIQTVKSQLEVDADNQNRLFVMKSADFLIQEYVSNYLISKENPPLPAFDSAIESLNKIFHPSLKENETVNLSQNLKHIKSIISTLEKSMKEEMNDPRQVNKSSQAYLVALHHGIILTIRFMQNSIPLNHMFGVSSDNLHQKIYMENQMMKIALSNLIEFQKQVDLAIQPLVQSVIDVIEKQAGNLIRIQESLPGIKKPLFFGVPNYKSRLSQSYSDFRNWQSETTNNLKELEQDFPIAIKKHYEENQLKNGLEKLEQLRSKVLSLPEKLKYYYGRIIEISKSNFSSNEALVYIPLIIERINERTHVFLEKLSVLIEKINRSHAPNEMVSRKIEILLAEGASFSNIFHFQVDEINKAMEYFNLNGETKFMDFQVKQLRILSDLSLQHQDNLIDEITYFSEMIGNEKINMMCLRFYK